jgi:hypothetical protein
MSILLSRLSDRYTGRNNAKKKRTYRIALNYIVVFE